MVVQKVNLKKIFDFFSFGNKILQQTVESPLGSDLAPFFVNLFLHMSESDWVQNMCRNELTTARGVKTSFNSLIIYSKLMMGLYLISFIMYVQNKSN